MEMFTMFFKTLTIQKISFFIIVFLVGYLLFQLIEEHSEITKINTALNKYVYKKVPLIEKIVDNIPMLHKIKKELEDKIYRCGLEYSSYQILGYSFIGSIIGFFIGLSINNVFSSILLTVIGFYIPLQIISNKIYKRTRNIDRQVMKLIQLFLNEYQKTNNVTEVFSEIIKDLDAPLDKEIGLVIRELNSGYDIRTALNRFASNIDNEWIYLFVNSLIMNKENGTEITQTLMGTLLKIANKEITEGDRDSEIYSGKVLTNIMIMFVPISFIATCIMQEEAYQLYFHTPTGQIIVNIAILCAVGGYFISKLVERI